MALQMNITKTVNLQSTDGISLNVYGIETPISIVLENVYFKLNIEYCSNEIGSFVLTGTLNNNVVYVKMFEFTPSVAEDSTNFIKQGYVYLKTLDEFKYAIDC